MLTLFIKRDNESAPTKGEGTLLDELDLVRCVFLLLVGKRYPFKLFARYKKKKREEEEEEKYSIQRETH